jgi:nitrite reductase/ring-hydroxylating ferredoxin subunit
MHVVCPWHGYEFDVRTGVHPGNPRARLRKIAVRVSGDDVIVALPNSAEPQLI